MLGNYSLKCWEKAFWYFGDMGYTTEQAEFYAKGFVKYAMENLGADVDDLLSQFVEDVQYSEKAEADKERSLHA